MFRKETSLFVFRQGRISSGRPSAVQVVYQFFVFHIVVQKIIDFIDIDAGDDFTKGIHFQVKTFEVGMHFRCIGFEYILFHDALVLSDETIAKLNGK